MARTFGIRYKTDEKHTVVCPIRWLLAKFVTPQTKRPPGAQLVRCQADDGWTLTRLRYEFKVVQPEFFEGQISWCHAPPTS